MISLLLISQSGKINISGIIAVELSFLSSLIIIPQMFIIMSPMLKETKLADGSNVRWQTRSSDTILIGDHLKTTPPKFGPNLPNSFRGEDF